MGEKEKQHSTSEANDNKKESPNKKNTLHNSVCEISSLSYVAFQGHNLGNFSKIVRIVSGLASTVASGDVS